MAKVCERCADPAERITPQLVAGQPFHPQTCARPSTTAMKTAAAAGFGTSAVAEHLMDRIQPGRDAVVETKFDGWRLSVHIIDSGGGERVVRHAPSPLQCPPRPGRMLCRLLFGLKHTCSLCAVTWCCAVTWPLLL